MKKLLLLLTLLISTTAFSQCVIDGTTVTGTTKAKTVKSCDVVVQSLTNGIVESSGDTLKTAVPGVHYSTPSTVSDSLLNYVKKKDESNISSINSNSRILYNDWIARGSGSTGSTHAMEWQNSGSGVLGYIRNDGYLKMMGGIYIENSGGAASQYNAVSTGSGTGDYSSYSLTNNSSDVGQLFLTSSTYNPIPFIGARALGFYNNGSGGIAIAADGGNIRFASGGLTENFTMATNGNFTCTGNIAANNLSGTNTGDDLKGTYSTTGTATTTFTVTIGVTMANTSYFPAITASNALSAAIFYVNNKTTTTFDVVYLAGLTGAVAFEWGIIK